MPRFTAARVLANGVAAVITYEAPAPVIIKSGTASVSERRFYTASGEVLGESRFTLKQGDSLMIMSDGVSQAGIGHGYARGWALKA